MLMRTSHPSGQTFRHTHRALDPNEAIPQRMSLVEQVEACRREAERQRRIPEAVNDPQMAWTGGGIADGDVGDEGDDGDA